MDWITIDTLKNVGGAAMAVSGITVMAKKLFPGLTGRGTQITAGVVSLAIAAVIGNWTTAPACLVSLLNAAVILMAAIGADQLVNYGKESTR